MTDYEVRLTKTDWGWNAEIFVVGKTAQAAVLPPLWRPTQDWASAAAWNRIARERPPQPVVVVQTEDPRDYRF